VIAFPPPCRCYRDPNWLSTNRMETVHNGDNPQTGCIICPTTTDTGGIAVEQYPFCDRRLEEAFEMWVLNVYSKIEACRFALNPDGPFTLY
jgi:hypothetical protein